MQCGKFKTPLIVQLCVKEGERRIPQGLYEMSVLTAIYLSMLFLFLWWLSHPSFLCLPLDEQDTKCTLISLQLFIVASVTFCCLCISFSFPLMVKWQLCLFLCVSQKKPWCEAPVGKTVRITFSRHTFVFVSGWMCVWKHANDACLHFF